MLHIAGWFQDVDQAAAAAAIDALLDDQLTTTGDDIRVSPLMPFIAGAAFLTAATTFTSAQLQSPTLRQLANIDLLPVARAAVFNSLPAVVWFNPQPIRVAGDESIEMVSNTDHAAAIEIYGLIWFTDAPMLPVAGEIFSVRATAAVTMAQGSWVGGALTFTQVLPAGEYDVVGIRAESANGIAARLILPGAAWRPGVPMVNAPDDLDFMPLRLGHSGVIGHFNSNQPPTAEFLGITDTAQTLILDLIKTA